MTGDDSGTDADVAQPRVPTPLRERVEELFVAQRGYEPASFQEALAVVVDLAEESADPEESTASGEDAGAPSAGATDASTSPAATGASATTDDAATGAERQDADADPADTDRTGDPPSDADGDRASDATAAEVSTSDVDSGSDASVSFDEYVEGLEETRQDPTPAVESILDTEHADDAVRDLAAEVLDEMTRDAFQELEHGVDEGVAGVTDGMGTQTADGAGTAPSGSTGDGVPDSLTADPESDCAVCERSHPVSVLQTSILEEDGSVELVCPSCAE